MKFWIGVFIILLLFLQYQLWFDKGGVFDAWKLRRNIHTKQQENKKLDERNKALEADVYDLKHGKAAVEDRARSEMGMIKKGEKFYQVVK